MLQLQRLEEKCSTRKFHTESKLKNILVAKLREDINSINKTALESISAINRTALESMISVNKTALESVVSVNKTALESIIDLKAQLPFLQWSFSYPSFHDELITEAHKSKSMFSNFPVIVKISGISSVFKPSCNFHQEVDIVGPDKHTLKLILYKYNRAYFLIRLYKKCLNDREHDWFEKFRVKLMNQITDSDHYDLHLSSEDFGCLMELN